MAIPVFGLFLLLFFSVAQADVLHFLLSGMGGRPWPWLPFGYGLVFCALAVGVGLWLDRLCRRRSLPPAWAWLVAGWGSVMVVSFPFISWPYGVAVTLVAVGLGVAFFFIHRRWGHSPVLWTSFVATSAQLLALCLFVGLSPAADDVRHYELRAARLLLADRPGDALKVGEKSLATSPLLFAIRCDAMSRRPGGLGALLFEQPVPGGGSRNLLYAQSAGTWLTRALSDTLRASLGRCAGAAQSPVACLRQCAEREGMRPGRAADYYLCALLLDRRLDDFVTELPRYYGRALRGRGKLPRYYVQALALYARLRTTPRYVYHEASVEANLHDYCEMADTLPDRTVRSNRLRRTFGDTYWWYFQYAGR